MTETLSLHEQTGGVSEAVSFARENAGFFAGAGTGAVVALLYRVEQNISCMFVFPALLLPTN